MKRERFDLFFVIESHLYARFIRWKQVFEFSRYGYRSFT
jgi:hypothetical protein